MIMIGLGSQAFWGRVRIAHACSDLLVACLCSACYGCSHRVCMRSIERQRERRDLWSRRKRERQRENRKRESREGRTKTERKNKASQGKRERDPVYVAQNSKKEHVCL